jgi:hypothetical protein
MSKNILLDCESYESTLSSISVICDIEQKKLIDKISSTDIDSFYAKNPNYYENGNTALWDLLSLKPAIDDYSIAWFHFTRVLKPFKKEKGILPLHLSLDTIWDELFETAKDSIDKNKWNTFRQNIRGTDGCFSELYFSKTYKRFDSGPYAMLNPNIAPFASSIGYHDYLRVPEIIEDICECFKIKYGIDIKSIFIKESKPCIVKFVVNNSREDCLKCALYYIYSIIHNEKLGTLINTCFDSKGTIIPVSDIMSITYVEH